MHRAAPALRRPRHGRAGWLHDGCRCEVCHQAVLEYARLRRAVRAVQAGGEPNVRVPAGPVRRKVRQLRKAGWTVQRIADAAGVSYSTVERIANRRLRNVALATNRAVMAVSP